MKKEVDLGSKSELLGGLDQDKVLMAIVGVSCEGLPDKTNSVIFSTYELLEAAYSTILPTMSSFVEPEYNKYVDTAMLWLLDKLGDSKRIKDRAMDVLKKMAEHPTLGPENIIEKLTRGIIKATTANSHKHLVGRGELLEFLVLKYYFDKDYAENMPFEPILEFALQGLKH